MATKKITTKVKKEEPISTFDTPVQDDTPKTRRINRKMVGLIICSILTLCLVVGLSLYYYLQYQKSQELLRNPLLASEKEQETLIAKVSELTHLPTGEQPTIAKVSDSTKLQGQPFFKNAQNGDVVLLYPKAKEAILYSPSTNKIITIGPINTQPAVQGATTFSGASTPVTIALYNGTTISGLTKKVQAELMQEMPNVTVIANTNAHKQDYTQTIVVDLTGMQSAAQKLAATLHGTVGSLPAGEKAPSHADMVVILGANQ